MQDKFNTYKSLNLPKVTEEVNKEWEENKVFDKSLENRKDAEPFVFYEGPPSANGKPGIHHVMARAIKDLFCRYQTLKGKKVDRKAGWDTHGLPVEISVEKTLGITKEDIGKSITVEDYNKACRSEVMKYKDLWDDLTKKMGYWVDLDDPYITFDNKYIESVWYLLKRLYDKELLYKGYTIQPFSPAAGTGLSTHELNQPGCYKDVKDQTATAQFEVVNDDASSDFYKNIDTKLYLLAWTTTPWTLPSNTALAVGKGINYVKVKTKNSYSGKTIHVILAKDLLNSYFNEENKDKSFDDYKAGDKNIPYQIIEEYKGSELKGLKYKQLIPFVKPDGKAFEVIIGDYVTTEDGTGIVHIAPTFGADDDRVAKIAGIVPLALIDKEGKRQPMVDQTGKFYKIEDLDNDFVEKFVNKDYYSKYAGRYVKNAYEGKSDKDISLDIELVILMKEENTLFDAEKHTHNYPHCWRTDKPVLYYPMDSWFVKTTSFKERMLELNKTINWKPTHTGEGRFGNWLENLVDWNLSRSRFWGIPLPIWTSEDGEKKCIGSAKELKEECQKAVEAGFMQSNPLADFNPEDMSKENYETFDLHRPYVDRIFLVSDSGKKMTRESDLIDVWFDSGSMPYAQLHYPFENKEKFENNFPADFIAEGVDQTRGWFFTLHAIATLVFDSVAYKTVVSNGLVLDKNGNKMSKRLGNGVDPFTTISKYGPDATRWYMITNAQPWDNLKFDLAGIEEVQRKFFGTLHNTYSFFTMYANIDNFQYKEEEIKYENRPELDRWILSELNSLIKKVDNSYSNYEPTQAGRAIQEFVDAHLSNWYVRLSRRRFWKGDYGQDKVSAYQTLYKCLTSVAKLSSPIAPFYMDRLFSDLNEVSGLEEHSSIHLSNMPEFNESHIDKELEERMQMAQKYSSMVLSIRKKEMIRVRQPLNKIMIPVVNKHQQEQIEKVKDLIISEVNVKKLEFISEDNDVLVKKAKPNFKTLGPKYGKLMKFIPKAVNNLSKDDLSTLENGGSINVELNGENITIESEDVEITTKDIQGWKVSSLENLTVAIDINIDEKLRNEGLARDLVNRIQAIRKNRNYDVVDKIKLTVEEKDNMKDIIKQNYDYICSETLAKELSLSTQTSDRFETVELSDNLEVKLEIENISNN